MSATKGRWGGGTLLIVTDKQGRQTYVGKVFVNGRQIKRTLGRVREQGSRDGLTKAGAATALHELRSAETTTVPRDQRLTVAEAGNLYLAHLSGVRGRKATTVQDYRCMLTKHIVPFAKGRTIDTVDRRLIDSYVSAKLAEGLAHKTVSNHIVFLGGLFRYAVREGWANTNPVSDVDRPKARETSVEIHYLTPEELGALYRAAPRPEGGTADDDSTMWRVDRVLLQTAAMTGLRQGELLGLRWKDVGWSVGVIRVRQTYTRGAWSTPKSKSSARAVPMADTLAAELERHHQASAFQKDGDLVFGHPNHGTVLDASALRRRFTMALERAGLRKVRFHDLRHSYGTAMATAGAPMRAIQSWMGHASITTTEIYAAYAPDPTGGAAWARKAFGDAGQGTLQGTYLTESKVI